MKKEILKKWRIISAFFALFCLFMIIFVRSFQLQILDQKRFQDLIENRNRKCISLNPERGTIYDRKKRELAVSIKAFSLYVRPAMIINKREVAQKLAPIINLNPQRLYKILSSTKPFLWIKRGLSLVKEREIKKLDFQGIGLISEGKRFYPYSEVAEPLIGFAGIDLQGLEGIELFYDRLLKSSPGYLRVEKDALGRNIFPEGIKIVTPQPAYHLILTIDKDVQYITQRELERAILKVDATSGTAIVMLVKTGEILAMAVYPHKGRNLAVTDTFEPGSTFKPILLSAALEEGIIKPQDIFFCENGRYKVGKRVIHDVHKYRWLTVGEVIKFSSNIGASKIAEKLGKEKFYEYIRAFGFGDKTGIDFPGEVRGVVPPPASWSEIALRNISFGQGISVNAIQLISAFSAIANGGILTKPYLVKAILDSNGKIIKCFSPQIQRRVLSPQTAEKVISILKTVVEEGTGSLAQIPGYEVAGKTGTAQKANEEGKGYSGKMIASFVGFAPANDPQIVTLVIIDEPKGIRYGGVVAAPAFREITKETLHHLGIFPSLGMIVRVKKGEERFGNETRKVN